MPRPPLTRSKVNMEDPGKVTGARPPRTPRKKTMLTLEPPAPPAGIDAAIQAGLSAFDGRITTAKDGSDVIELTFNLAIAARPAEFDPTLGPVRAAKVLILLADMVKSLPTQNRLDEEALRFQQFSTPPHLAYLAAWVANLDRRDVVLEPSAGTGNLAVFALNAGCTVFCNEISHRRATLLRAMPVARVFQENAEQLHNILDPKVAPSVILMNPPFSVAGTRMEGKKVRAAGCLHIDQALLRLAPGGRLVAIIGDRMHGDDGSGRGMADMEWWNEFRSMLYVRASIGIPGREYSKFGTHFGCRLIVADKVSPPTPDVGPLVANVETMDDAMTALCPIRLERDPTPLKPKPVMFGSLFGAIPAPEPKVAVAVPVSPPARLPAEIQWPEFLAGLEQRYLDRLRAVLENPSQKTWGDAHSICVNGAILPGGQRIGHTTLWQTVRKLDPTFPSSKPPGEPWPSIPSAELIRRAIGIPNPAPAPLPIGIVPERKIVAAALQVSAHETVANLTPLTDAIYEPYVAQRLFVTGAQPHPTPLVESAAMASVMPPEPRYAPCLPRELIDNGTLSIAQLEAVVYAGQAHSQFLAPQRVKDAQGNESDVEFRKGFLCSDSPGVGKGRAICAVILDSFARGQRKAVWMSKTPKLIKDAIRDWTDLGGIAEEIIPLAKIPIHEPIRATRGILFLSYGLLKASSKTTGKTRLDQVVEWVGKDSEIVMAFDECHCARNALP
jgi:hypothetical protein